ncbi:hypothetical protein LY76DRAFT_210863 [Colletotrichum caudatum]|nr:hypothetical protein LY76DRAFT_210863 [Colletotrichum caudatum]
MVGMASGGGGGGGGGGNSSSMVWYSYGGDGSGWTIRGRIDGGKREGRTKKEKKKKAACRWRYGCEADADAVGSLFVGVIS